jgi:hypothetical protein
MEIGLVHLHNLLRWVIIILLIVSILKSYTGWKQKKIFTSGDKKIFLFTMVAAHITLLIGLYQLAFGRYGVFVTSLPEGVKLMKDKFYRFYWVEHPTGMIISIVLITLGYGMSKKMQDDEIKFKKAFWYFFIALLVILISVPWPFREIIGRPIFPGLH